MLLEPLGLAPGPIVPTREWRELYGALDSQVVAAIHPFYTASIREFEKAGRTIVGSAPVGQHGTAAWLDAIGNAYGVSKSKDRPGEEPVCRRDRRCRRRVPDQWSYHACQATKVPNCSSATYARRVRRRPALRRHRLSEDAWSDSDREWLEANGVEVRYRASLEQDLAAMAEYEPDLAIGTTPVVQKAKEAGTPALYFTNLISARPLMGVPGPGSLAQVVNAAMQAEIPFRRHEVVLRRRRQRRRPAGQSGNTTRPWRLCR